MKRIAENMETDHRLDGVARTALWTAAARARESGRPDRLFDDPYAAALAGDGGIDMLHRLRTTRTGEDSPFLPVRTRWFDDFLTRACRDGVRQFVILGAGLDTRAVRMSWPGGTRVYEVDQAKVLAYKREVLEAAGATAGCDLRSVPAHLDADWPETLLDAGHDRSTPTAWIAEGVLFYLSADTAGAVLKDAAKVSAAGSRLAVDLIGAGFLRFPYLEDFRRALREAGSPWLSATDDPWDHLARHDWCPQSVTEPDAAGSHYGRPTGPPAPAALPDLPRAYLVTADKVPPPDR